MSKPILSFAFYFLLLTACAEKKPDKAAQETAKIETPTATAPIVGADVDKHGCKGSAGYTWSVVKNECIRIFEAGIRLDAKAAHLHKTSSAFIVFKSDDDDAQAELFLASEKEALILAKDPKDEAGKWTNADYVLSQWKGYYILENKNKVVLYQGAATQ